MGIQIYGRTTEDMVEAAKIVEQAKPDVIDINFGCPVKKVAGKGAGAGMLRNIPLMLDITREVVKAVNVPVTVKTRLGWDCENRIITELAEQFGKTYDDELHRVIIHGILHLCGINDKGPGEREPHHHRACRAVAGLRNPGAHHPRKNPKPDVHG